MASSEDPEMQIIESQIEEEQEVSQNQAVKRPRKKTESKKKKIIRKQELKKPIDGKQQFGDKSICRLCKESTQSLSTAICNRCHFKYHKECIANQDKEPQYHEGEKWMCVSCIERVAKRKLKDQEPQKKKKPNQIQDYFKNPKPLQEDKSKKLSEFQLKYPTYVNQGRVVYPILDEYLTAYQGLFQVEIKKKPQPKEDPVIPQEMFEDVLKIWDSYNNLDKIVSDILYINETEQQSQLQNIGSLNHFKDNHRPYSQKTRLEIYDFITKKPEQLILFFSYFYLKQIIEDLEIEQMQKQQYKIPYWHLMGYMWFTNRVRYYELLKCNIMQLPIYIHKQGILKLPDLEQITKEQQNFKLILAMVDGLEDLKKTPFLYQFRTENLLSNNRMKTQLGIQIKSHRSHLCDKQRELTETETEYYTQKQALINDGLSRQESSKVTRMMENSQRALQKLKQQITKTEREVNSLTERYNQLEQDLQIIQLPSLLLNPSMLLGYDLKNCQYYFFLYEPDKIFVCYKDTFIDEQQDMKWGIYNIDDVSLLLATLQIKGVRESALKSNILELQRTKLLSVPQLAPTQIDEEVVQHNGEGDIDKSESLQMENNEEHIQQYMPMQITLEELNQEFQSIEESLTTYLSQKNSRWCSSEIRNQFKQNLDSEEMAPLCKAIEFFVENTMMQEKLELRLEEESEDKQGIEQDEDSNNSLNNQNNQNNRNRKVVEDDSSNQEIPAPLMEAQTFFQQLEQMENGKVRIRKLPMKLFGTYYETLRLNLVEQLKNDYDVTKLKIALEVLGQIVKDYIDRKKNQLVLPQIERKRQDEIIMYKKEKIQDIPQIIEQPKLKNGQYLRTRIKHKPQYAEIENRWEDVCKVCNLGGKVVCCDTCPKVYHPKCINLKEVPQGKWNCLHCLSNFERQVKTRATIKKLENQ